MTDYNALTVANLRQVLKERGIPSTGLTRKAQIIEKLQEADTAVKDAEAQKNDDAEQTATPVEVPVTEEAPREPETARTAELHASEDAPVPETSEHASPLQGDEVAAAPEAQRTEHTVQETPVPETGPEPVELPQAIERSQPTEDTVMEDANASALDGLVEHNQEATLITEHPAVPQTTATDVSSPSHNTFAEDSVPTPPHDPNESQTIEEPEGPATEARPSGSSASLEPSRINSEELESDQRKRKRRSESPDMPLQDIKAKKPRPSGEPAPEVYLTEDQAAVRGQDVVMDDNIQTKAGEGDRDAKGIVHSSPNEAVTHPSETYPPTESTDQYNANHPEKKDRYKALLQQHSDIPAREAVEPEDRDVPPALHPATPALYIRNLMRPLKVDSLRQHLFDLGSPPSTAPDPDIVKVVFLDSMRTHAFAVFASTTAASRVRLSLHGSVWPAEGGRKPLWVDFVPEDNVMEWIAVEEEDIAAEKKSRESGRRNAVLKKYEVVYKEGDDGMTATFQELGANIGATAPPTGPAALRGAGDRKSPFNPPSGPRGMPVPTARPAPEVKDQANKSFQTLDTLFRSTKAKPKLYWIPVDRDLAEDRLDELDRETSRDWDPRERIRGRGSRNLEHKMKFGWQGDRIVECGPIGESGRGEFRGGNWRGGGARRGGGGRGGRGGGGWRSGGVL